MECFYMMTKDEILQNIIEAIEPLDEINADTVIADCDDIDSLALFSVVVFLKQKMKKNVNLADLSKCTTVGDIVELAMK